MGVTAQSPEDTGVNNNDVEPVAMEDVDDDKDDNDEKDSYHTMSKKVVVKTMVSTKIAIATTARRVRPIRN